MLFVLLLTLLGFTFFGNPTPLPDVLVAPFGAMNILEYISGLEWFVPNVGKFDTSGVVPRIGSVEVSTTFVFATNFGAILVFIGTSDLDTSLATFSNDSDVGNFVSGERFGWVKTAFVCAVISTGSEVESEGSRVKPNSWNGLMVGAAV